MFSVAGLLNDARMSLEALQIVAGLFRDSMSKIRNSPCCSLLLLEVQLKNKDVEVEGEND